MTGETVQARPDSTWYRLRKAARRHWIGLSASAAVLIAVLTGAGVSVVQAQRAAKAAARERVVKEFVADVFRINARGMGGTAALQRMPPDMLLQHSAKLIQTRFAGQPDLQAELYGVVGGIFADMGAHRLAADYATRQIEALVTLRATQGDQALATLALAEALLAEGRNVDAEPRIRRALEQVGRDPALRARAMVLLARFQVDTGRFDEAAKTLDQTDSLLASMNTPPPREQSWVIALRAESLVRNNRIDEAYPYYERAARVAIAGEGVDSVTAIDIRLSGARWYRQIGDLDRVNALYMPAIKSLRTLGGPQEIRANFETARHHWLLTSDGATGTHLAMVENSLAELKSRGDSVPSMLIAQVEMWLGAMRSRSGDLRGASELIANNEAALLSSTMVPIDRFFLLGQVGLHAMQLGDHARARLLLRERQAARVAAGRDRHPYAANDYRFIAENEMMAGRFTAAEQVLREAPEFEALRVANWNPQRYNNLIREMLARVRLEAGNIDSALATLPIRGDEPHDQFGGYSAMSAPNGIRGEALCRSDKGPADKGLALLGEFLATKDADIHMHAPWLARLRSVMGLCALRVGNRRLAVALANQARAAFAAQPEVSSYYKAPLSELDRRLAQR